MNALTQLVQLGFISAGSTVGSLGTVIWSNSNGIVFGMNGQTITASYTVPTQSVQPAIQSISAGATRITTGEVVWSNANGIQFGINGQTITASYTVPTQSVQPGIQSISAGATRISTGEVVWGNANGIQFGINGQTVTASYTVPTQSAQTLSLHALSNTTQSTAGTVDARSVSFVGAGLASVGVSNSSVIISVPTVAAASVSEYDPYPNIQMTNNSTMSRVTSGSFGLSVTYNNSTITLSHPMTTNNTGYVYSSTTSAALNISSQYTGLKLVQFPVKSTIAPGIYWLGLAGMNSSNSNSGALRMSWVGGLFGFTAQAPIGSLTSAFSTGTGFAGMLGGPWGFGHGSWTSAGQTDMPATVAFSAMSAGVNVIPMMKFWSTQ